MTAHPINFDAIRAGATAALEHYPADPPDPKVPPGKHRVLWRDDYWRGIDLANEVLDQMFGPRDERSSEIPARQLMCRIALGRVQLTELSEAQDDLIPADDCDVLCALIGNLRNVGDPEREGPAFPGDLELDADCREEA